MRGFPGNPLPNSFFSVRLQMLYGGPGFFEMLAGVCAWQAPANFGLLTRG